MNIELTKQQASIIRKAVKGEYRSISRGRSRNSATVGTRTPITVIDGDSPPELIGQPYLKTQFRNGAFQKTLYTPSTLEVTVGKNWIEAQKQNA